MRLGVGGEIGEEGGFLREEEYGGEGEEGGGEELGEGEGGSETGVVYKIIEAHLQL